MVEDKLIRTDGSQSKKESECSAAPVLFWFSCIVTPSTLKADPEVSVSIIIMAIYSERT